MNEETGPKPSMAAADALDRYEAVRSRMPGAAFPATTTNVAGVLAVADRFDAMLLDAYGVLKVGNRAVPGAARTVAALVRAGKRVLVLTNGATLTTDALADGYRALGFTLDVDDVVSSRAALGVHLAARSPDCLWGVAAPAHSRIDELAPRTVALDDAESTYAAADGFVLLSSRGWSDRRQALLETALARRPRPLLVGNPDLVAPTEHGLSLEPGYYAHQAGDRTGVEPVFFGKPFANVFELVRQRLAAPDGGPAPHRVLMVGDSLHTDILGGAAAGHATLLITGHGLLAGLDWAGYIERTGIVPDFIAPTT